MSSNTGLNAPLKHIWVQTKDACDGEFSTLKFS